MKKVIVLMLTVLIVLSVVLTGCGTPAPAKESTADVTAKAEKPAADGKEMNVAVVLDLAGVNDQAYNQSAWEGMQKLKEDFGYNIKYLESAQESDFGSNLDKVTDEAPDMIWGIGFLMADAMLNIAETNPEQRYGIIDSSYEDERMPENLTSALFKAEEASFLAGYIAGSMSKTNHVGFVGPVENPIIERFEVGYDAGVAYAGKELGKDIKLDIQYGESFTDTSKAKAIATVMYNDGADIVFAVAGGAGLGVIEAAKEMNKFVIGVDRDQNYLAPDNVITSVLKNVNKVIYKVTKEIADGKFAGGKVTEYGLADDAVGLSPTTDKHVPAEILKATDDIKAKIVDGTIVVPRDKATLMTFISGLK